MKQRRTTATARMLSALADVWPSPMKDLNRRLGGAPGSDDFERAYAVEQFMRKVWFGVGDRSVVPLWGKRVLEIGCGHGGITCYLAGLGARQAVGIDLNDRHLRLGTGLVSEIERASKRKLPAALVEMDASTMGFAAGSFDVVMADNVFEHLTDPGAVLREVRRVLRPDGLLVIPVFSSIKSKYGAHVKQGLKLPWLALLFSDRTIIDALKLQARRRPELLDVYPGLDNGAVRLAEIRRHADLNDLTYRRFREIARESGFTVTTFRVRATLTGKVIRKVWRGFDTSSLAEVLSTGAWATLRPNGGSS